MASPTDRSASGAEGSFAARLRKMFGKNVDPGVSLEKEPADPPATPSSELVRRLSSHAPQATRYKLQGEIARGGMGAILEVWDEDLRRTLAMKVILGKGESTTGATPKAEEHVLARFLEEAQVTGQLDHPGIVPVHELAANRAADPLVKSLFERLLLVEDVVTHLEADTSLSMDVRGAATSIERSPSSSTEISDPALARRRSPS